jgi:hypothetical protein
LFGRWESPGGGDVLSGEQWRYPVADGEAVEVEAPEAELHRPENVSPKVVDGLELSLVVLVAVRGSCYSALHVGPPRRDAG